MHFRRWYRLLPRTWKLIYLNKVHRLPDMSSSFEQTNWTLRCAIHTQLFPCYLALLSGMQWRILNWGGGGRVDISDKPRVLSTILQTMGGGGITLPHSSLATLLVASCQKNTAFHWATIYISCGNGNVQWPTDYLWSPSNVILEGLSRAQHHRTNLFRSPSNIWMSKCIGCCSVESSIRLPGL